MLVASLRLPPFQRKLCQQSPLPPACGITRLPAARRQASCVAATRAPTRLQETQDLRASPSAEQEQDKEEDAEPEEEPEWEADEEEEYEEYDQEEDEEGDEEPVVQVDEDGTVWEPIEDYYEAPSEDADEGDDEAAFVDEPAEETEEPEEPHLIETEEEMRQTELEYANYREAMRRRLGVESERVLVHDLGAYLEATAERPWVKAMKLRWAVRNMERDRRQLHQCALLPAERIVELGQEVDLAPHPFAQTVMQDQINDLAAEDAKILDLQEQALAELARVEHITEFWTPI